MSKNDYESEMKKIHMMIMKKGKISLSEIARKTQHIPGHLRADFLDTLIESDQAIAVPATGAGGRKTIWYFDPKEIESG